MNKNFFNFFDKIFEQTEKSKISATQYLNVTDKFVELSSLKKAKNLIIYSDNLDVKVVNSEQNISCSLFLSKQCDVSKLSVKVLVEENDSLKIDLKYHGDNAQGYLLVKYGKLETTKLNNINGDIVLKSLLIKNLYAKSVNGDVVLNNLRFEIAEAISENGDIIVNLIEKCKLQLKTKNGEIQTNNIISKESASVKLVCETINGDIVLRKQK